MARSWADIKPRPLLFAREFADAGSEKSPVVSDGGIGL
jgi:hypothetical protein